ncbi:hypothetical protein NKH18_09285 [Streptomyces sp. M10(2022)]
MTAEASESGLVVGLHIDGEADGIPPVVERAAHRVVQEALTNIAKHAPGASATVRVTYTVTETEVVVENGPPPTAMATPPRHGAGPHRSRRTCATGRRLLQPRPARRGFAVVARLPHISRRSPTTRSPAARRPAGGLPRNTATPGGASDGSWSRRSCCPW